jgi:hypothetical protein
MGALYGTLSPFANSSLDTSCEAISPLTHLPITASNNLWKLAFCCVSLPELGSACDRRPRSKLPFFEPDVQLRVRKMVNFILFRLG